MAPAIEELERAIVGSGSDTAESRLAMEFR